MNKWGVIGLLVCCFVGCGRYFPGLIVPASEDRQTANMTVKDDGSISYTYQRLEISIRPVSDEELNRQFAAHSKNGGASTNPYTYGDWKPVGDTWTPPRFTVFQVKLKNYQYPKMQLDPANIRLVADNGREYSALNLEHLSAYYQSLAQAQAGNAYARFEERKDILQRTLLTNDVVFSGQENVGYVVFPRLHYDVKKFTVIFEDIVLRFDYKNEPIETLDLRFFFERPVYKGYYPSTS